MRSMSQATTHPALSSDSHKTAIDQVYLLRKQIAAWIHQKVRQLIYKIVKKLKLPSASRLNTLAAAMFDLRLVRVNNSEQDRT